MFLQFCHAKIGHIPYKTCFGAQKRGEFGGRKGQILDGRNRARVIAESLARVIAAIRVAFVGGHISSQNTEMSPHRPCVRCAAIRIARLAFIRVVFVPLGPAEWPARVDRVRWTLAIGDWRFGPSKGQMVDLGLAATPGIRGWNPHPPNLGGTGFQGSRSSANESSLMTRFARTAQCFYKVLGSWVAEDLPYLGLRIFWGFLP